MIYIFYQKINMKFKVFQNLGGLQIYTQKMTLKNFLAKVSLNDPPISQNVGKDNPNFRTRFEWDSQRECGVFEFLNFFSTKNFVLVTPKTLSFFDAGALSVSESIALQFLRVLWEVFLKISIIKFLAEFI